MGFERLPAVLLSQTVPSCVEFREVSAHTRYITFVAMEPAGTALAWVSLDLGQYIKRSLLTLNLEQRRFLLLMLSSRGMGRISFRSPLGHMISLLIPQGKSNVS